MSELSGNASTIGHTLHMVVFREGVAGRWYEPSLESYVLLFSLPEEENHVCVSDEAMFDSLISCATIHDDNNRHLAEEMIVDDVWWGAG